MQFPFLTPRVERLRADGGLEAVHEGGVVGRLRPPVVLLARDLCTFASFETAALPKGRRRQAARLHARAASPYVAGGASLVKCGADFGVWWWDLERISPFLSARYGPRRPLVRPETLAQPTGSGWRIVKLAHGYEAQYWRDNGLLASGWRRDRYDVPGWSAFARLVRGADSAPEAPPVPLSLPIAFDSEAFSLARAEISRNQALGLAAGSLASAAAAVVLFMMGQGLHLRAEAAAIEAETAELRLATPRAGATRSLELDRRKLAAYRQAEERTNPVAAAGAAIGIVAFHDLTPDALEVSEGILTMTLPYTAARQADALVADFEGSGYFFDVRPRTDAAGQTLIIEMQVREAAPPLTADG